MDYLLDHLKDTGPCQHVDNGSVNHKRPRTSRAIEKQRPEGKSNISYGKTEGKQFHYWEKQEERP